MTTALEPTRFFAGDQEVFLEGGVRRLAGLQAMQGMSPLQAVATLPPLTPPPGFEDTPIPKPTKLFLADCLYSTPEPPVDALEGYVKFWIETEKYGFVCYTDPITQQSKQCFFHASGLLLHRIALYRENDHELVAVENEPNLHSSKPGQPSIPHHLSKGVRLTLVLYPNEEKGIYAGRWYPSAHYEDLCSRAARFAEDRRKKIIGLPRYTLVLENALVPILTLDQWETEAQHTMHTLLQTNLVDRVAYVWQWASKILEPAHQRLVVIEERTDPITLDTETEVLPRWVDLRERLDREKEFNKVGKFYPEAKDL